MCRYPEKKSFVQGLASHFTVVRVNAKKTGKQYLQRIGETRARKLYLPKLFL